MNTDPYTKSAAADLRAALGDDTPPSPPTRFHRIADRIGDLRLFKTCHEILETHEFPAWPAAISMHHAYEGGLLAHTIEVTEIALKIADQFPQVNRDVLIAAALWHDFGKVFEYRVTTGPPISLNEVPKGMLLWERTDIATSGWVRNPHARHHILTSAQEFVVAARKHGVDRHIEDAVVHCILAHHGPVKEWGSPEAPRTIEALILHQADMLSAGYGATKEKP